METEQAPRNLFLLAHMILVRYDRLFPSSASSDSFPIDDLVSGNTGSDIERLSNDDLDELKKWLIYVLELRGCQVAVEIDLEGRVCTITR